MQEGSAIQYDCAFVTEGLTTFCEWKINLIHVVVAKTYILAVISNSTRLAPLATAPSTLAPGVCMSDSGIFCPEYALMA